MNKKGKKTAINISKDDEKFDALFNRLQTIQRELHSIEDSQKEISDTIKINVEDSTEVVKIPPKRNFIFLILISLFLIILTFTGVITYKYYKTNHQLESSLSTIKNKNKEFIKIIESSWIIKNNKINPEILNKLESILFMNSLFDHHKHKEPHLLKSLLAFNDNELHKSLKALTKYGNISNSSKILEYKAVILEKLEKYNEAFSVYDQILKLTPRNARILYRTGVLQLKLDNYDNAIDSFLKSIKYNKTFLNSHLKIADTYIKMNNSKKAIDSLISSAKSIPENHILHLKTSKIYLKLGEYKNAFSEINKSLNIDNKNSEAWYIKGSVLASLNKYTESKESLKYAIELNPANIDAWIKMGMILQNNYLNDIDGAISAFEYAITLDQFNIAAWLNKGDLLMKKEKYKNALICYETVIDIDEKSSWGWEGKANALLKLGKAKYARDAFKTALKIDDTFASSWEGLIKSLLMTGEHKKAMKTVHTFLNRIEKRADLKNILLQKPKMFPSSKELTPANFLKLENYLKLSKRLGRKKRFGACLIYADKALDISPYDTKALSLKAYALSKLNRKKAALETYKKLLKIYPNKSIFHFEAARLLLSLNKKDNYLALFHVMKATIFNPKLIKRVKHEKDFNSIKKLPEFNDLIASQTL